MHTPDKKCWYSPKHSFEVQLATMEEYCSLREGLHRTWQTLASASQAVCQGTGMRLTTCLQAGGETAGAD